MDFTSHDEVEYFGFLGLAFTNELEEELQGCLNELFHSTHIHQRIQTFINEAFKKNFFIFNNFVLRNILKFPQGFKLERKVTDKIIEADLPKMIAVLVAKQNKIGELQQQLKQLKESIGRLENRKNGYANLLKNKIDFMDMCTGAREIKSFLKETNDLYGKYKAGSTKKDSEFEKLMEYKNIKSEYYKSERERLLKIAGYDALEQLAKSL